MQPWVLTKLEAKERNHYYSRYYNFLVSTTLVLGVTRRRRYGAAEYSETGHVNDYQWISFEWACINSAIAICSFWFYSHPPFPHRSSASTCLWWSYVPKRCLYLTSCYLTRYDKSDIASISRMLRPRYRTSHSDDFFWMSITSTYPGGKFLSFACVALACIARAECLRDGGRRCRVVQLLWETRNVRATRVVCKRARMGKRVGVRQTKNSVNWNSDQRIRAVIQYSIPAPCPRKQNKPKYGPDAQRQQGDYDRWSAWHDGRMNSIS